MLSLPFLRHLNAALGTKRWCIAPRLTLSLADRGYRMTLTRDRFDRLRREWESTHD